ncbi:MAG: 16S rRNA (guanine(527)-N(7))-methyltransferase RsmG [Gammaproteobacteria bacterium]|nr:16S rRNA (guanine(527)-N(7))-methyltransferase RsmG [Gammaproteobacteria bacterium]
MNGSIDADVRGRLEDGLRQLALDTALAGPLLDYLALLVRWNRTYNLTAVRDPGDMVVRHLLDSLAVVPHMRGIATLADLGTGPGLPGIPLAIALPTLQVALVESSGKKARFLRQAVRSLGLANASVHECRAEDLDMPGAFQALTARALATLAEIIGFGGHLLEPGGRLLAMKGVRPDAEIAALPEGWRLLDTVPLAVPGLDGERHLVTVQAPA